jgi:hypothetical protein
MIVTFDFFNTRCIVLFPASNTFYGQFFGSSDLGSMFDGMGGQGGNTFFSQGGMPGFAFQNMSSGGPGMSSMHRMNPFEPSKAQPIERTLLCTLEDLYTGKKRKMKITRNLMDASGYSHSSPFPCLLPSIRTVVLFPFHLHHFRLWVLACYVSSPAVFWGVNLDYKLPCVSADAWYYKNSPAAQLPPNPFRGRGPSCALSLWQGDHANRRDSRD